MCFGGGGSQQQAPTINFTTPRTVGPPVPAPISKNIKPLIDTNVETGIRPAGETKRRKTQRTPKRQSLSSGVSIASNTGTSYGGINL